MLASTAPAAAAMDRAHMKPQVGASLAKFNERSAYSTELCLLMSVTTTAKSGMLHVLDEPRAGHCVHVLVRRSDHGFNLLYAFVIVRLGRRELVWINVTVSPTAEWIAQRVGLTCRSHQRADG